MARIVVFYTNPEDGNAVRELLAPLPMNREKLASALYACQLSRDGSYTSTVTV